MGPEQMAQALAAGACDYVMPDARAHRRRHRLDARRGAGAGRGRGDVEPPVPGGELPPAGGDAHRHWLEYVDWADAVLDEPLRVKDGHVMVPDAPGIGLEWDEKAVKQLPASVMFTRHFPHWPPGQPKTLELPRETVYANLAASAARYPQRAAIDYYGSRDLLRAAQARSRRARRLPAAALGVARGDRVLLYAQNCPQFVIAYYAILRADAVVVPVNPMNRTEELRHYVEDSDARVAIVGQDVLREIAPLAA